jgi:hypothetical protein
MEYPTGSNGNFTARQNQFKSDVNNDYVPTAEKGSNTVELRGEKYPLEMVRRLGMERKVRFY